MINTAEYDNRLEQELTREDFSTYHHAVKYANAINKTATRDKLYFGFRYRNESYKSIKAGIQPSSVMMRFGNDRFRLYGEPENNKLFDKAKQILASWKVRSKQEARAEKLKVKLAKKNKGVIVA